MDFVATVLLIGSLVGFASGASVLTYRLFRSQP